ncbi:MAG: hypothetical protein HY909_17015 [Deltaproteobacteria bacterium]|nr:hypothetical protein [Deltaproteobacteria bacterium]
MNRLTACALVTLSFAACAPDAATAPGSTPAMDPTMNPSTPSALDAARTALLQETREATERYSDEAVARADGFEPVGGCVSSPLGGMGVEYVNRDRMDMTLDVRRPEALLYVPEGDRMRLVAVKFMTPVLREGVPYTGADVPEDNVAPVLFGQTLYGPVSSGVRGEPWRWELYAWVWRTNPDGTFAPWNRDVTCP